MTQLDGQPVSYFERTPMISPQAEAWTSGSEPYVTRGTGRFPAIVVLASSLLALAWPVSASAQHLDVTAPDSLITVREPLGVRSGAVIIYPRADADIRYDSNVYNSDTLEQEDFLAVLRPGLTIRPDLARHDFTVDAGAELRRYFDVTDENSEQYYAQVASRLDLRGRTEVTGRLLAARRIERRGTVGDQFLTDEPVAYDEVEAAVGVARRGGIFGWSGSVSTTQRNYKDPFSGGERIDTSTWDHHTLRGNLRGTYRVSGRMSVFAQGSANRLEYDREPSGPRGSSGFSVLGGVRFEPTDLTMIEGGVGFMRQSFNSEEQDNFSGVDYYVSANWRPTSRLTVAAAGSRAIERSPLIMSSAVVESDFRLSAAYVVGARLLAGLEVGTFGQDYQGIDRKENRHFAEASLRYSINPQLSAFAAAGYRRQTTDDVPGREYDGVAVRAGIGWAL